MDGDREWGDSGFDAWVAAHRPRLIRMAGRILRDGREAEDVVESTLAAVWRKRAGGTLGDASAYAGRAVWINAVKARSRRRDHAPLDPEAEDGATLAGADPELEPWELERALLGLPPEQQAVLRLRYYAGLSFREIASSLSISINTAASRCRYALAALRNRFGAAPREEDHGE